MKKLLILWLLAPFAAHAEFIVSDPSESPNVTHCGLLLDAAAKVDVVVASGTTGKYCKFDTAAWSASTHTVKATFVIINASGGRIESDLSAPFTYVKYAKPAAPAGWKVTP
jgi:hypothetical protein